MKRFYLSKLIIPVVMLLGWSCGVFAQTTFSTAGGPYAYTVPAGVTTIGVDLAGAQGGTYSGAAGGLGGRVKCDITVTPGSVLQIYVGGTTTSTSGGVNGGATGSNGGGGGGGSDIRTVAGSFPSRLVVGGGGGGATYYCYQVSGGFGGYPNGGAGVADGCWGTCYVGNGASTSGGGAGASCGCGSAGSLGNGGTGACGYAGGGGGGYYGGGGGYYGPGGGGSSWANSTATNLVYSNGSQSGNGYVTIYGPSLTATPGSLTFPAVTSGTTSVPALFFTMNGTYMGASPLTITPPANYLVSLDGITWSSTPINYTYSGPNISRANVYVKFVAPATAGSYCGNISITGGGLSTPTLVNVCGTSAAACSGSLSAGVCQVTPSTGGTLTAFTLSLLPLPAAGNLTFQWQSSTNLTTWTDMPGAVTASYNFIGISATTYYRCIVSCPASGSSVTYVYGTATYAPMAGSSCIPTCLYASSIGSFCGYGFYCGTSGQPVTINGEGGTQLIDNTNCGMNVYTDLTSSSSTCTFKPGGGPYNTIIGAATSNIISEQVWIDFNNDGTFIATETIGGQANSPIGVRPTPQLNIPTGVLPGIYRMRVEVTFSNNNAAGVNANYPAYPQLPSCPNATVYYTEVRDYKVTIGNGPCSGTPNPGIADASVLTGCQAFNSNIFDVGATVSGTGITYQWMQSPTGSGYFVAPGVSTNAVYTPTVTATGNTYYICKVTCSNGGAFANTNPQVLTLNTPPTPIVGTPSVCTGLTQVYTSSPSGGVWTSSNPTLATIGTSSGIATGVTAGTPNLTYTLPSTGCFASTTITVNSNPSAILPASPVICKQQNIGLSSTPVGGTWSALPPTVATVGSSSGVVNGVNNGSANVTYTLPTGCFVSTSIVVNPLPNIFLLTAPFGTSYCAGSPSTVDIRLSGSTVGVNYQLLLAGAPVGSPMPGTGAVLDFGIQTAAGVYTCVATNTVTACSQQMIGSITLVINPLPTICNVYGGGSYCPGDPAPHVFIGCSQFGVNYKLYCGATLVGIVPGTSSIIDFGPQTLAGTYTVIAQNATTGCVANMSGSATININPLPTAFNMTGGGSYCTGGTGVDVGLDFSNIGITYTLYNGSSPVLTLIGTGSPLDFGLQTAVGCYTVTASNTSTGCVNTMNGTVCVSINTPPAVYNVIGGGAYCSGGAGAEILLDGSEPGVNYQLLLSGSPVGTAVGGTGLGISLGFHTIAGTYTVVATNATTGCSTPMNGSAVITINPLPTVYNVTGGGNFCVGGTGVHVGLTSSTAGVSYQLMLGGSTSGSPLIGTGSSIDFGLMSTAGIYTVVATDPATGCSTTMNGIATVGVNPLPTPFNVTGTGSYCAGGAGVDVGLDFSATGVSYQLYRGGAALGGPVTGTGGALDFGMQTIAGTYTVVGTNTTSGCINNMNGSAVITVNPLPTNHLVTGGGQYCAGGIGVDVGLNGSDAGISYQLYLGFATIGSPLSGTGSALDFGFQTSGGTYTITATDMTTGCTKIMLGNANVVVNAQPNPYTVIGGGIYCAGGSGIHIGLSGSQSGVKYQLLIDGIASGLPLNGTGSVLDFGAQLASGTYTVRATNNTTGCTNMMTGSSVIATNSLPVQYTVMGGGSYCVGDAGYSVTLSGSDPGINYQLKLAGVAVGSSMSGTGSSLDFGLQTAAGAYTVEATDGTTGCTNNMTGSVSINVNPLPASFTVTGGGAYCAGGTGYHIFQALSNAGVNYQLYNGGTAVGSPVAGTGAALDFGVQTAAGTYTVTGMNATTGCANNMTGSADIVINALPDAHNVTGGGGYCPGGTGVHIGLDNTDMGMKYQLYHGSTPVGVAMNGTGSSIDFGMWVPTGNYTVVATNNTTACMNTMTGLAAVSLNPTPVVYSVTGGGNYCATGLGVNVGVSSSETGVSYQLYQFAAPSGIALPGTGGAIDFGRRTAVGTYYVKATSTVTGCTSDMGGSAVINIMPVILPHVNVTPSIAGTVCVGQSVTFNAAPVNGGTAPTYQWMVNGVNSGVGTTFHYTPVNGDVVTALIHSNATCAIPDTGSTTIVMDVSVMQMPSATVSIDPGMLVCAGAPATFTAHTMFGGPMPELLWIKNGLFVSAGPTYTYTPSNGDIVTFMLGSDFNCRLADTVFSAPSTITVQNAILPTLSVTANTGANIGNGTPVTFTANVTHGTAVAYQWFVNTHQIAGATNATYTTSTLSNMDSVTCEVTGLCGLVGFNSIVMHVSSVGVKPVTNGSMDVRLVPNPNKGDFNVRGTVGTTVDQDVTIEIADMLGQVVYTGKATTHNGSIDEHITLSNTLANGMYILNLRAGSDNTIFHFVIEQ